MPHGAQGQTEIMRINMKRTVRPRGRMRKSNAVGACALAMLCSAAFAGGAAAANFCVGPNDMTGCPAGSTQFLETELADAIAETVSNGAPSPDSIYLYSGVHSSPDGFDAATSNIRIYGVGPTKPVLTIDGIGSDDGKTVLHSENSLSLFQDLAIQLPAADLNTGLSATLGGTVLRRIDVSGPLATNGTGFSLDGQGIELLGSSVDLPYAGGSSTAVNGNDAASLVVSDLNVARAEIGIKLSFSQNASIQRTAISAPRGIDLTDSPGAVISSSLLQPSAIDDSVNNGFSMRSTVTTGNAVAAANVYNSTLIGRTGSTSAGVVARSSNPGSEAFVTVDSTVIYGHDAAAQTINGGTDAVVNLSYSRYQGGHSGSGTFNTFTGATSISIDPGFTNAGLRDFSIKRDSSLVDVGNPGALTGSSSSDVIGNPRIVSRGAGNIRDIGAYELQNRSPEPRITIVSPAPITTSPTVFSAAASTDADGDAMTFSWRFDGNTFANGVTVQRQFADPGPHSVELTATDSTGRSESTMMQFNVQFGTISLQIRTKRIRMSKKGRISITVSCPDGAVTNCTGRMILETKKKFKGKKIRAASYVFSIEPGTTRKLNLQAYNSFKKALKRYKKLDISVRVLGGSTTNALVAASASTITVLTPR